MLTVGSCFSGIGGIELGLEWTGGFETKWQIEMDAYASKVLEKHWPHVKRYRDIRDVVRPEPVDLICGGFPCQDVSLAGKRAGLGGKRSTLWSEMFRLICEVKPRWVVAENVPGLLSSDGGRFLGNILRDLASAGYDAEWGVLSAAGVGAPHLRRRIFILANPKRMGWEAGARGERLQPQEQMPVGRDTLDVCEVLADAPGVGVEGRTSIVAEQSKREIIRRTKRGGKSIRNTTIKRLPNWAGGKMEQPRPITEFERPDGREIERDFRGVAHGVSKRVDRLKCLGNSVVPQVAQKIGEMILNNEIL